MVRHRVDAEQAKKACDAVRGGMSVRSAAARFHVGRNAITRRLSGEVTMDGKVGPGTVMTEEEENAVEDILLFAARHFLSVGRVQLREAVRQLCSDGRKTPWEANKGPEKAWVQGFLKRHPCVSERSTRIYEANRITENDEPRIRRFYEMWGEYIKTEDPKTDHLHNTDETGMRIDK